MQDGVRICCSFIWISRWTSAFFVLRGSAVFGSMDRAPVIGCICKDQTLVDMTGIPKVSSGDIAVLIGKYGDAEISACDLAEQAGTISNEILSRLGKRLKCMIG